MLEWDAATVYRLDRAIETARAEDGLVTYKAVSAALRGDRSFYYDLLRQTEGAFAANIAKAWDDVNQAADEAGPSGA